MPNTIKYSTSGDTQSLKKGNFFIGVGDVPKGPSSRTNHWQGITPPTSGYTIYINVGSGSTAIMVPENDTKLVEYANGMNNNTNYFTNGGNFSNGGITPFDSAYSDAGGVGQVVSIVGNLPYSGSSSKNALYLNYNGGRRMGTSGLLTTGVTYTFSFWAKIISGSSFTISWNNQNGSGETNAWTSSANLTTEWKRYTQTFTYNAARIYFFFSSRSADTTRAALFTEFQLMTGSTYGGPGLQNAAEALNWFSSVSQDEVCVNRDYEPIVTDGLLVNVDAGYTPSYPKTGTTLYGLSMNGNNCTLANGPTYTSINGGGVVFDGVDDTYSIPNVSMGTSALTIDCWFKYKTNSIYLPTICGAGDLWSGDGQTGWGFGQQGTSYLFKMLKTGSSQSISLVTVNDGMIYNFVGTRTISGTQQILKGYLNGKYINQSVGNSIYDLSTSLYPGSYDPTTIRPKVYSYSTPPPATLYGIKVYNRDLSAGEILQNYQATLTRLLGENIVTNNLSVYLDAGYTGSYVSGTTWYDVAGVSGITGTLTNGPTYSAGVITFDGVDDYANLGNLSYNRTNFSVFVWVNFPTYHTNWRSAAISKWNTGGSDGSNNEWFLGVDNQIGPSPFACTVQYGAGGSSLISISDTVNYVTNTWYNVGFTWNSGVLSLYKNGVLVNSATTANTTTRTTTQNVYIASFYTNPPTQYCSNVKVGSTQIYNRTITGTEVLQNYNAQKSRYGL